MKRIICLVLAMPFALVLTAQPLNTAASDAFMVTRMAEKFHLQPKPLNDAFSTALFDGMLSSLDDERIFFTQEDMKLLLPFRFSLDEEVRDRRSGFLQTLSGIYGQRLKQADTMISSIGRSAFDLNAMEKFTVAEDTAYPANHAWQRVKIRKLLKAGVLGAILDDFPAQKNLNAARQKKFIDSLEAVYRKKMVTMLRRTIARVLESPGGITQMLGERYCELVAGYFDPHTSYFSITAKENFESELGQKTMMFGFGLDEHDEGYVYITELKPGSPAYQSGQLNEGDKLRFIQWEGKAEIDVSDASLREVAAILSASNHDKVKITVQKADGSQRQVELTKAKMEDDSDAGKVKSFLLKGAKTVGYISLPAFYEDWENEDANVNGCANDVAKEIIKLKKEGIEALILDVRYNGGGSIQEAIELTGIFIDAGPVGQIKDKSPKVITLKDVNRGTIYDGPLLIMVNGASASASEFVAATLQDYNRAVVVGSPTYGKATGQLVFPMDTTISLEKDFTKRQAQSYIKMTTSKIYRVNGATAQFSGVQPDVVLPDIAEADPRREADAPFAIPATGIEANKYYKPLSQQLPVAALQQYAKNMVDTSAFFNILRKYILVKKEEKLKRDISLNWNDALQQNQLNEGQELPAFSMNRKAVFSILGNRYDEERLQGNKGLRELHDNWKAFLSEDPYLQVTFHLALLMIR